ncbi:MAG: uroporphyrinogen decarboxylase family protein, partial [Candidatus Margulisiibacteriota bacterium]
MSETDPLFLQAFDGTNQRVPVWFMRQAGRYLPEYQKIKEKYTLNEMFRTPDLAAEITCQPIDILGVDAAIIFADILTLPAQMGFDISFGNRGPWITNRVTKPSDADAVHDFEDLSYVGNIIKLVSGRLPKTVPLIGFAGSPFTVLTYLIEGGVSPNFNKTFSYMNRHEVSFRALMAVLTKNTIEYLNLQKKAGIKAFQLFDSWAGILPAADYARYVLPYVQEIFLAVDLPSIY